MNKAKTDHCWPINMHSQHIVHASVGDTMEDVKSPHYLWPLVNSRISEWGTVVVIGPSAEYRVELFIDRIRHDVQQVETFVVSERRFRQPLVVEIGSQQSSAVADSPEYEVRQNEASKRFYVWNTVTDKRIGDEDFYTRKQAETWISQQLNKEAA